MAPACRSLGEDGFVSTVPAGLDIFSTCPGIEMPGYSQLFLRNRMPAQKQDEPARRFPPNFFWTNISAGSKVETVHKGQEVRGHKKSQRNSSTIKRLKL